MGGTDGATRVALLVDGDNLPASQAGWLLSRAARMGRVVVRRSYVDPSHLANWLGSDGFDLRVARQGRNAADLLLAMDAVELSLAGGVGAFALGSSDGGFAALALRLVERGHAVLGLGGPASPRHWRRSCTTFLDFGPAAPVAPPVPGAA